MRYKLSIALISYLLGATLANAQALCPQSDAVGIEGIGDGCSTFIPASETKGLGQINLNKWLPHIGAFRGTFTPACHAHDKCYTQLGTTRRECDENFKNALLEICNKKYRKPHQHPAKNACRFTARNYASAVHNISKRNNFGLTHMQTNAFYRTMEMRNAINGDKYVNEAWIKTEPCATTPERTTLFSPRIIAIVNSAFTTQAGRLPTIYEFFEAVLLRGGNGNLWNTSLLGNEAAWKTWLNNYALSRKNVVLPSTEYDFFANNYVGASIKTVEPETTYRWNTNIGIANTPNIQTANPNHIYSWFVEGSIVAQRGFEKNMAIISRKVSARNVIDLHRCPSSAGGFWSPSAACTQVIGASQVRGSCVEHTDTNSPPIACGRFEFPASGGSSAVTPAECQGSSRGGNDRTTIFYNSDGWSIRCTGSIGGS
jgi:hypothetical protein